MLLDNGSASPLLNKLPFIRLTKQTNKYMKECKICGGPIISLVSQEVHFSCFAVQSASKEAEVDTKDIIFTPNE
jgi:hypothetical protein